MIYEADPDLHGPAWSPDGDLILFPEGEGFSVMRPDGSGAGPLVDLEGINYSPDWQPINKDPASPSLRTGSDAGGSSSTIPSDVANPEQQQAPETSPPDSTSAASVSRPSASPGEQVTVSGSGFAPNVDLGITLRSDPVRLGVTRSDASGAYEATVSIPPETESGDHRIVIRGPSPTGKTHESSVAIAVDPAERAGTSTGPWAVAVALLAGSLVLTAGVVQRRRNERITSDRSRQASGRRPRRAARRGTP